MEFLFRCRPVTDRALVPQLSAALEKRTELLSRKKYPGMWHHIDYFSSLRKNRSVNRSRLQRQLMAMLLLILGVILLVPGLMAPREKLVLLLGGLVGIGFGFCELFSCRKLPKSQFDRAAEHLLATRGLIADDDVRIRFREDGMTMEQGTQAETVPYEEFEYVFETAEAYLVTYRGLVLMLLKRDLTGAQEPFSAFLREKTGSNYLDLR